MIDDTAAIADTQPSAQRETSPSALIERAQTGSGSHPTAASPSLRSTSSSSSTEPRADLHPIRGVMTHVPGGKCPTTTQSSSLQTRTPVSVNTRLYVHNHRAHNLVSSIFTLKGANGKCCR